MMMPNWFAEACLAIHAVDKCGQLTDRETTNLGLGHLYYALTRIYQPKRIVCIGSLRGFAPIIYARGLVDNDNPDARVTFIDPGLVDDHWHEPEKVKEYFEKFGVSRFIQHHRFKTEELCYEIDPESRRNIDILYIDGLHTAEQAEYDFNAFELSPNGIALFHDSISKEKSTIYKEPYDRTVYRFIEKLRYETSHGEPFSAGAINKYEVFTIPFYPGLTLVKHRA